MSQFWRHHYVRLNVLEDDLEQTVNDLFQQGYDVPPPEEQPRHYADHYREEHGEEELLSAVKRLLSERWIEVEYEPARDDEALGKTYTVTAWKIAPATYTVIGIKKVGVSA